MFRFSILWFTVLFNFLGRVHAQSDIADNKPSTLVVFGKSQALYLELIGNSLIYSFNYDTRFKRTHAGWGYHLGLGWIGLQTDATTRFDAVIIPLGVNHLLGKRRWMFESGVGWTIVNSKDTYSSELLPRFADEGYTHYATATLGVRWQPTQQGFLFRLGYTPSYNFNSQRLTPISFGLSLGYGFHN